MSEVRISRSERVGLVVLACLVAAVVLVALLRRPQVQVVEPTPVQVIEQTPDSAKAAPRKPRAKKQKPVKPKPSPRNPRDEEF